MKKGLILLGFAIVALSSCTKDTTKVVNNGHAIDFRAATTKGASLDYTYDLNSFFVTAITLSSRYSKKQRSKPP